MTTLEALRRQVRSATTLGSVVRTMKALATVRIGQVRAGVRALDAGADTLELAFQVLVQRAPDLLTPAAPPGRPEATPASWGAVVVGSDHGLCGPFNERLAAHVATRFAELGAATTPPRVIAAGRRLRPRIAALGFAVDLEVRLPASLGATEEAVVEVLDLLETWQRAHGVAQVFVVYQRPSGVQGYRPRTVQLLPLDGAWLAELRERPWPSRRIPMLGLDPEPMLRGLVRLHLTHVLVRAFAASQAAENTARLAAMEAAERSVDERLTALRHAADLARQNAVTEELLDVQAGYVALAEGRGA